MDIHLYTWIITVVVMIAVLAVDLLIIGRRPHEPSMKEAGIFGRHLRLAGDPVRPRGLGHCRVHAMRVSSSPAG